MVVAANPIIKGKPPETLSKTCKVVQHVRPMERERERERERR
jgi:hypothetical protein